MLKNKNIVLGVTGGIAAYKACSLTSKLTQKGANVRVIMTDNARKFVSPLTFQALSRHRVYTDTFIEEDADKISHIDLADWADMFILAPATANSLGKLAHGIADDMLSTTLLATQAKVYIAPAMNVHMYAHPAVIRNMQELEAWGYHFIEPGAGYLACGYVGKGRLEEPETIIQVINEHQYKDLPLKNKQVLITSGPTQEKIDPVRFMTNHSSGKMGFALAEAAAQLGADVTLVTGVVNLDIRHPSINRVDVTSAEDMYQAVLSHFEHADIVIKAAAVADYKPIKTHTHKLKKSDDNLTIEMERTKDILQMLGQEKIDQFLVGFAAETDDPITYGVGKLRKKNLDAIIINDISAEGIGFASDENKVTYVNKTEELEVFEKMPKTAIARQILLNIIRDIKDAKS